ncbi:MAG: Stp1/IreP family PP2C-type Ser/Thr phosphatase [Actinobacteria bacterium]|nr:Stp1/IreP family PP2C-type Ser/Thr phosphatase [Actinomycetota bacterium]
MTSGTSDLRLTASARSDRGRVREGNEDSLYVGTSVFAVADGMGGHVAGEVASETALTPLADLDGRELADEEEASRALAEAIDTANGLVVERAAQNPDYRGMGTTLTAVLVRQGRLHLAHVGDSRAYLLRRGEPIVQLTTDHTLVEQLVREGRLSRAEAATHPQRSVITRAVGVEPRVQVDSLPPTELQPDDQVLLCSDGLTGPVDDDEIARILHEDPDADSACQALVDAANANGGPDNITVVLLRAEPGAGDGPGGGRRVPAAAAPRPDHDLVPDAASPDGKAVPGDGHARGPAASPLRVAAAALVVIAALTAVGGAGVWVLSRSWFVSDLDGSVAIFRGVDQEVAGIALSRLAEKTDLRTAELPPFRRRRLAQGIEATSREDARQVVDDLRPPPEPPAPPQRSGPSRPGTSPTRLR